ncbi:tetratricopeptide repeat protein [Flavobacterium celericrescens]|uniref:Tetratricopeptide repeat protein n=1 Tax=Flavobacterium celericrescens TaxID=2709780 RepID=A0ABX0I911_9FLAO|nr:tetratricopeptide repeat protein [Flavobacterium celericrescens]NHM03663.1 tetratricopeptide repeat protein [Flavobacterium celericrescens]
MTDWYRRKSWTESDETEFFAKLNRARKDGRAQYLKIQAIELLYTENKELLKVAESLLIKMLNEYSEDNFNKSSALHNLGNIYKQLGNETKALDYYEKAIDFEIIFSNVQTQAYLDYSELIIKTKIVSKYKEVEKLLMEKHSKILFPIEKYKVNSILSIINKYNNKEDEAFFYAKLAEESATAETSGFRYHKFLGVVTERESWLDKIVKGK